MKFKTLPPKPFENFSASSLFINGITLGLQHGTAELPTT
jgi:hypothetical protein